MTQLLQRPGRLALAATLVTLTFGLAHGATTDGDERDRDVARAEHHDVERIVRGYAIVPAGISLNLAGKSRALVGLGSYVVNTVGCNDCHTHPSYAPGGDPFQGQPALVNVGQYLAGGRTFGPFVSANLTPDHAGRPAGLTLREFTVLMRTGHDPKDPPGRPLQVMPWPAFGRMLDTDLRAIYEYLRAIPPLPDNPNPGP